MIHYSWMDILLYLYIYSFLGFCIETFIFSIMNKKFTHRGVLNLPLSLVYGCTMILLIIIYPTLEHQILLQYLFTIVLFKSVWSISSQILKKVCNKELISFHNYQKDKVLLFNLLASLIIYLVYLLVHPLIFSIVSLCSDSLIFIMNIVISILLVIDFVSVKYTIFKHSKQNFMNTTNKIGQKITSIVWSRLQKAYPGIELDNKCNNQYTFGDGICFDKLVWIFLLSSFLGAIIEMIFCRLNGYPWMNRSSLLYGPFSVVWGLGACLLTIVLQYFYDKKWIYTFICGFLLGGSYEYACSVFTEYVFGTIFWDYSHLPFNIGGRVNGLYCVYWGVLAVIWIKWIYPFMENTIEKIPPLRGKIFTWIVVIFMTFNCLLTSISMIRYTERQDNETSTNIFEEFIDQNYDNEFMEKRWPNMKTK